MNAMKHLSIIMDGNGRWAQQKRLQRSYGHICGAKKAFEIIDHISGLGRETISTLSLFAFSTENWQRPEAEVALLMKLLAHSLKRKRSFLAKRNIRVHVIGDRIRLPSDVKDQISVTERQTQGNTGLDLLIAVNYSGQYDIFQAVQRFSQQPSQASSTAPEKVTKFEEFLLTARFPDPDLLIRTGGENRISNFFLWQSAYSEIHFEKKLWPDFEIEDLVRHIQDYLLCERRFGKTSPQLLER